MDVRRFRGAARVGVAKVVSAVDCVKTTTELTRGAVGGVCALSTPWMQCCATRCVALGIVIADTSVDAAAQPSAFVAALLASLR